MSKTLSINSRVFLIFPPQVAADPWRGVRGGGRSDRHRGRVLLSLLLLPALQEATAH